MITKVINVNLHQPIYERLTAKQGDIASRYLLFHLLDGDKPFDLTGKSVRVYARKPDKTEIFNDLIINDETKGYCTLELTSQCLAEAGIVKMELYISQSGKVLTSIPFDLEVISCINTINAIVSTNEFSALEAALGSLQDYDNLKREIVEARKTYGTVGKRLDNVDSQLEQITYNACALGLKCDGTDETVKLQEIINNYNKVLVPRDVKFSTVEIKRDYQEIKFDGKITIVAGGYGLKYGGSKNVINTKVNAKNIIGESGAKCGVVFAISNFCELNAERIEGFDKGLYFDKDGNGTENRIKVGVIQLCNTDISIENSNSLTTSKHEGNVFNVSCFSANTGVYIEKGCKYQHFQGVIDCAMTDKSMDIVDKSGGNIFHLYYVRGRKVQLSNSLLYIFSNETNNQINLGNMAFGSDFISNYDEETTLSFKGYRFMNQEGRFKFKHIGLDATQNNTSCEICEDGYFAIVKRLQGGYGGNFINFNISSIITEPVDGMFVDVIDTDSNDKRIYRFYMNEWNFMSFDKASINNVDINNGGNAVITHQLNADYTNLDVKLLVNDNGKFYPLESKLKYSVPNNNQIVIYNDHTTPLRILYIIKRIL